eukprot:bmy_15275T0
MIQCLIRKLAALSQYEEVLAKISSTSTDRLTVLKTKPQSIQRDIITVCSDPYTLAQQLTHIELHQMDPSSNFYNYRTALRGAAQRSLTAHSSREKIVIPFFSLLIKDIYFLNEGCANRLPNGHVNFEVRLQDLSPEKD